jgi:carbon storage regulator
MLSLSRKFGEAITIGDEITIIVGDINQSKVRLHISAPVDLRIARRRGEEVYQPMDVIRQCAQRLDRLGDEVPASSPELVALIAAAERYMEADARS